MNRISVPIFVTNKERNCAIRLIKSGKYLSYYRDGGEWSTDFKIVNDRLFTNDKRIPFQELFETNYEDWKESNGQYAPIWVNENYDGTIHEYTNDDELPF